METTRRDFMVGLFLLISVGVMAGALVLTSQILERRIPIYMRMDSGDGITQDTRVLLQGLPIGRVTQVTPRVDSVSMSVTFVAQLSIRETFPDGTRLSLPVGTQAVIEQRLPAPIGQTEIRLQLPGPSPIRVALLPGDTIESRRSQELLQALDQVVQQMREEVFLTLEESRRMLTASTSTINNAAGLMAETRPAVLEALEHLSASIQASERLLADVQPRIGPLYDSLTATLGDTRRLLQQVQTIADTTETLIADSSTPIRVTLEHLVRATEILEHFADQVSRRPTRMLTGVQPPARDTNQTSR